MPTISEEFENLTSRIGDNYDKVIAYAVIGGFISLLEDGIDELYDDEISNKFEELQSLVQTKQKEFLQIEV